MKVIAAALLLLGLSPGITASAAPVDIWQNTPVTEVTMAGKTALIDAEMIQLPALVRPAADFQKVLFQIRSGADAIAWRGSIDRAAQNAGGDSVTVALRELARCWQARLAEVEIDKVLRKFYRVNVRFPDRLDEVQADIPPAMRVDPWGEPWIYKTAAPAGFAKLDDQRYELGPTRYPHLSKVDAATQAEPAARDWKISLREVAGVKILDVRTSAGQSAVFQLGARLEDVTLAYVGDGWALFADTEGLFTMSF